MLGQQRPVGIPVQDNLIVTEQFANAVDIRRTFDTIVGGKVNTCLCEFLKTSLVCLGLCPCSFLGSRTAEEYFHVWIRRFFTAHQCWLGIRGAALGEEDQVPG